MRPAGLLSNEVRVVAHGGVMGRPLSVAFVAVGFALLSARLIAFVRAQAATLLVQDQWDFLQDHFRGLGRLSVLLATARTSPAGIRRSRPRPVARSRPLEGRPIGGHQGLAGHHRVLHAHRQPIPLPRPTVERADDVAGNGGGDDLPAV